MISKGKIGFVLFIVFVVIGNTMIIHDENVCKPKFDVINNNLFYIRNANPVKKIELYNVGNGGDYLITKPIIIEDSSVIESIRNMINLRQRGEWNHPAEKWRVNMRMTLDNNQLIDLEISKIVNDPEKGMTHISLYVPYCDDESPYPLCSLVLGEYLEKLTGFK